MDSCVQLSKWFTDIRFGTSSISHNNIGIWKFKTFFLERCNHRSSGCFNYKWLYRNWVVVCYGIRFSRNFYPFQLEAHIFSKSTLMVLLFKFSYFSSCSEMFDSSFLSVERVQILFIHCGLPVQQHSQIW